MLQGELDLGRGPSHGPWERLFFAVLPDIDTAHRIDRLRRQFCDANHVEGAMRGRKRLHVSLHHVGDYTHLPSRIVYAAKQAGKAISWPSFEVTLHSIRSFPVKPPKQALVLLAESAALVEFHEMLGAELRKIGLRSRKHFAPHVTLLYGPDAIPRQAIEPIRFVVSEFVFIHSELGLSRYNVVDRWPLEG